MTVPAPDDVELRHEAIDYVQRLAERNGGVVSREELEAFRYRGERIALVDQSRGIRNPQSLPATLSLLSTPKGPYNDRDLGSGLIRYSYREGAVDGGDNRKLRRAAALGVPVIFLRWIEPGLFVPFAPAYIVDDDEQSRSVTVAVDESLRLLHNPRDLSEQERSYVERVTKQRLHQPLFRARVLRAYEGACAMCRLRHLDLLDAAHILSDGHPLGDPVLPNGLALCKIHHAAYDRSLLGVRPDLVIEVQPKILIEVDGPMLRHGLQDLSGEHIQVPKRRADRPDEQRLAERYEQFRAAASG